MPEHPRLLARLRRRRCRRGRRRAPRPTPFVVAYVHLEDAIDISASFQSQLLSEQCGFPVTVTVSGAVDVTLIYNDAGLVVRHIENTPAATATFSSPDGSFSFPEASTSVFTFYAYATKQRSARAIERHCRQDIAYRVVSANQVPDHATIARFVARHEAALGALFGSVLALCAKAGLVSTGVVAIDGTKLAANASREANLDYKRIAREIVAEAKATDEAEDELYGEARGDELPDELRTSEGRRRWLREAEQALDAERAASPPQAASEPADEPPSKPRGSALNQGRRGWHRVARQRLDERRAREARPIPRLRQARLSESKRRLEEELAAEREANEAYEAWRARGISRDGRRFGGDPPNPHQLPDTPAGTSPTGDERHSESQSGHTADSVKASQLAAGRSLSPRPDVTPRSRRPASSSGWSSGRSSEAGRAISGARRRRDRARARPAA